MTVDGKRMAPAQSEQFIADNWEGLAALAWRGYQRKGRGFIVIDTPQAPDGPQERLVSEVMYMPESFLREQKFDHPNPRLGRMVEQYDPEHFIVALFLWRAHPEEQDCVFCVSSDPLPKDTEQLKVTN
jgi:hypothetical protein